MRRIQLFGLGLLLALGALAISMTPLWADLVRTIALAPTVDLPSVATPNPATPVDGQPGLSALLTGSGPSPTPTVAQPTTPAPTPTPKPKPVSYLEDGTLLTAYGRAFGVAPILGRLGSYQSFADMAADIRHFYDPVAELNDGKTVIPALHFIYALAIPCTPGDDCLLYLEGTVDDVEKDYIQPAAARGWQVILDTQLGRSDPVTQVKRMIAKGYLNYDHVHVAIDPEFSSVPGEDIPGIPIGTIDASEVNAVQELLDEHVRRLGLRHKKILIVHQFGDANVDDGVPFMIRNKKNLRTYENVDLVIDADGFGTPDSKVSKYNRITDHEVYPFIRFRGIKIFPFNPHEEAGHLDKPLMTFRQIFGLDPTPGGLRMRYKPDVIIVA